MDIFDDFRILDEPFVTRDSHAIMAHILLPKNAPSGPRPIIINWHGGYLIMAHGLYAPYFPQFILDLAKKSDAIIISPDYTLLPHNDGLAAVQADVLAFHKWLLFSFASILTAKAPSYEADLTRVLLNGGSAGGYVATTHALAFPDFFRALALTYPMLNFDTEWWRKGSLDTGSPNPMLLPDDAFIPDTAAIKEKIQQHQGGARISATEDIERLGFAVSVARKGLFHDLFSPHGKLDEDSNVWINRRIQAGAKLPERIWLLHGGADTAVPVETSIAFAETMKSQGRPIRLDIVENKEHGFDAECSAGWKAEKDPIILNGLTWLVDKWLE
ncbi:hypothetical protein CRV24_009202 [Beauveria bassiana]|uniref:Alpha/beta hydrolase fold-3 domain protein n=1 Tax=Beauveria bassiana (strain ARSEF 2860) TaxID=655819 RepID=J4W7Z1_BEAB2|nr:Alpha/beta hydrolase fold-3 domain protein [Beauveria bassiana ARSEF 2860]EJP66355.1 Alpha/beta hydrolase fold-3 domain protein [Beauveria bassiana ARSEF 2860]KAF1731126.1 hypothetical protein CRV24_009202 [Beauveria bassiana]KAH8707414.1 hypothetical protein HC256_010690 [Beauveria bassiana]